MALAKMPPHEMEAAMIDVLSYCYVAVGLRASNFPTEREEKMMIRFIKNHYGMHTPEEFILAFDMAITGKLELDRNDVKVFENFSVEYFCKIINAYRVWSTRTDREIEKKLPPPPVKLLPQYELDMMIAFNLARDRDQYLKPPLKKLTSKVKPQTFNDGNNSKKQGPTAG